MIVNISVDGQTLKWSGKKPKIAAGSIEFVRFRFVFSSDWDGCTITAQFTQEEKTYDKLLNNNECSLPNEIVEGTCSLSCFGYTPGGEVRATAAPLHFGVLQTGFIGSGENQIPPTPDLYSQLLVKIDDAVENVIPIVKDGTWWVWSSVENDYVDTGISVEGPQGPKGDTGANGTSVRHWWDGTVLYIASASGTSSADLRGPAGEGGTAVVAPLFVSVTNDMFIDCPVSDIYDAVMSSRPVYLTGFDQNGSYMVGLCVGVVDNSFVFTPYIANDGQTSVYSVALDTGAVSMLDVSAVYGEQFSSVIYEALAQAKASGEFDGADGKDGEDGADGITPHIGANGNWFIGTTDTGKPSRGADGKDGVDGKTPVKGVDYHDGVDGQDGYTPVKNVDYFDGKDGEDGADGANGKTAYQYAKDGGYTGSESDFALKLAKECPSKISELTNDKGYITSGEAPVQSVNGETGAVHLTASDVGARSASWMPTAAQVGAVPAERTVNGKALSGDIALNAEDVGARSNTWTPTYTDVGAEKSGTAASAVTAHNSKEDAHNDIRLLIAALTTRLDALANSDDTTLDQMAEVVAYIKDNRGLIEQITTGKVSVADIVNNLTTNVANKPLSAAQGVALKALIDAITVPTKLSQLTNDKGYITGYTETDPTVPAWAKEPNKPSYDKSEVGLGKVDNVKQYSANNPPPYPVTSVNGKTGAVTLDAAAVGALTESALGGAVNNALEQAKASGAFDGATGQRGTGLLAITTAPSSYTTEVNGITPTYRIALDTVKSQAGVDEVLVGDTLRYSYYHYPIIYVDASYVYCRARVNIRGATGAAGATPEKGTDYFTPADKTEMVNSVKAALPTLTVTGVDADGVTHTWTMYGVAQ